MFRAVVFDFDGLIMDTETPEYEAWLDTFRSYGQDLPLTLWGKGIGTDQSGFDPCQELATRIGRPLDCEAISRGHDEVVRARLGTKDARPGVRAYLQQARAGLLKIGLASSSHRDWVVGWLQHLGLLEFFDAVITADDVDRVKPSPAVYLACCQKLGVEPSDALALEDSPHGAMAALCAGLTCVVVTNPMTHPLSFPAVHRKLGSMAEVPFGELLKILGVERTRSGPLPATYNARGRGHDAVG